MKFNTDLVFTLRNEFLASFLVAHAYLIIRPQIGAWLYAIHVVFIGTGLLMHMVITNRRDALTALHNRVDQLSLDHDVNYPMLMAKVTKLEEAEAKREAAKNLKDGFKL